MRKACIDAQNVCEGSKALSRIPSCIAKWVSKQQGTPGPPAFSNLRCAHAFRRCPLHHRSCAPSCTGALSRPGPWRGRPRGPAAPPPPPSPAVQHLIRLRADMRHGSNTVKHMEFFLAVHTSMVCNHILLYANASAMRCESGQKDSCGADTVPPLPM